MYDLGNSARKGGFSYVARVIPCDKCYNDFMEFADVKKARQTYRNKIGKCTCIALVAMALAFLIGMGDGTGSFWGFLGFGVVFWVSIVIIFFVTRKAQMAYRAAYKAYFVEKNLRKTFTDVQYSHEMGLDRGVLSSTQMINMGDVYGSNDLVTGRYKDVAFAQADVHIQERHTDSDGNTTYVTIFKGRFMVYEFPKEFNFRLEVVEKRFGANRVPGGNPQTGRKFEKIEVESNEFNKIFKTYAEDGFEAFYLLDPVFIQNVLVLGKQYKGKIFLGFLDNKLIVGIKDGKDAFEPPNVFRKLDEATETEKVAKDIHLITNFVDQLKLNRKLFK